MTPPNKPWTALLLAVASAASFAGPPQGSVLAASYTVPVQSQKAAKFDATMRQQFDFSCGSAAVATLLTYHFGTPTSEEMAFDEMLAAGDREQIRQHGFSLLDMKQFLAKRGFEADGFELPLEKLVEARIPAIVLINENGYHHFVVVKGLRGSRVLLGDPATGLRSVDRAVFERLWINRLLFVIHNRQGQATFNAAADWRHLPAAPLAAGVARDSMSALTIPRHGLSEH